MAYEVKNQYYFGSELIAAPITVPRIPGLNAAGTTVWLPKGTWYDISTGMVYEGDRSLKMYRGLDSIPVLAKAGGILPFTEEISAPKASKNPDSLTIYVYAGADGEFTLYEDDNESQDYREGICVKTRMTYREAEGQAVFAIEPATGRLSLIPQSRSITVNLVGFLPQAAEKARVRAGQKTLERQDIVIAYDQKKKSLSFCVKSVEAEKGLEITLPLEYRTGDNQVEERVFEFLDQAELPFDTKDWAYRLIQSRKPTPILLAELLGSGAGRELTEVLTELLTASI